ncbi:hypothetical protein ACJX0J_012119 [Zea mays]
MTSNLIDKLDPHSAIFYFYNKTFSDIILFYDYFKWHTLWKNPRLLNEENTRAVIHSKSIIHSHNFIVPQSSIGKRRDPGETLDWNRGIDVILCEDRSTFERGCAEFHIMIFTSDGPNPHLHFTEINNKMTSTVQLDGGHLDTCHELATLLAHAAMQDGNIIVDL